jgi:hypothetical protein
MIAGLEEAVEAGVIDQDTAKRLEPYLAAGGTPAERPDPDDEKLRLVTGFNDIFVTIGLLMFLGALGYMLSGQGLISSLVLAAAAWGLAEFFTRMRRMALPSIVLLIVFVGAVFVAVQATTATSVWGAVIQDSPGLTVIAGFAAAVAAGVHWWRFQVPITVAAGAAALVAIVLSLGAMAAPELVTEHPAVVFLPLGLLVFALAMWFDSADLKRQTRRTDIAFWLHLLAAPLIVHPLLIGLTRGEPSAAAAGQIIVAFLLLAVVALVIDRRAMLVSCLAYLTYAVGSLFSSSSIVSSLTVSILLVGAIVLLLSAAWRPLRRAFVAMLPQTFRERLPAVA